MRRTKSILDKFSPVMDVIDESEEHQEQPKKGQLIGTGAILTPKAAPSLAESTMHTINESLSSEDIRYMRGALQEVPVDARGIF